MIEVEIPGYKKFCFRHLVLDVNGTLAEDGNLIGGVAVLIEALRTKLEIHLVTADTHGKQQTINHELKLKAVRIPAENQAGAKLEYIEKLGTGAVVAVGNGANDAAMLEGAALGIAVVGPEGAASISVFKADIVASDIRAALELLLFPKRMMATLRR
jgi:P-type E1-E2 ATPase